MPRLTINPDSPAAWEVELKPGVNSLGRSTENDIPIEHPSVSSSHCQIIVAGRNARIKDVGSVSGTFVEDTLVEEMILLPGQKIRLGEIAVRFDSDLPADSSPAETASARPTEIVDQTSPVSPPARLHCRFHPKASARFLCPKCHHAFCDLCVNVRQDHNQVRKFCRSCGVECEAVLWQAFPLEQRSFFAQLPGAFKYPFQGSGAILLVAGTLFFLFLGFVSRFAGMAGPYGAVAALMIGIFTAGYLFSYAKCIITSSAQGEAALPDWPDFNDWRDDILMPFGQLVCLIALTLGPALILRWWQPGGPALGLAATLTAAVLGALLAPMGMLALAMFDSVGALNPIALVWSILRAPIQYLISAAAFEVVVGIYFVAGDKISSLMPVPILPGLISGFINLYLIVVGMRILGLFYATEKSELGWFNR